MERKTYTARALVNKSTGNRFTFVCNLSLATTLWASVGISWHHICILRISKKGQHCFHGYMRKGFSLAAIAKISSVRPSTCVPQAVYSFGETS